MSAPARAAMPDADRPKSAARKWETLSVEPCGCGGGVRVVVDGETLTAADVDTMLAGSMAFAAGIRGMEAAITEATGQTRAVRRRVLRHNAATRRILRDQAIRHLCDKRGLGVRAVAADLKVGKATVARALSAAGRDRTRRDIERLRVEGYEVRPTPLDAIRGMLRGGQRRAA